MFHILAWGDGGDAFKWVVHGSDLLKHLCLQHSALRSKVTTKVLNYGTVVLCMCAAAYLCNRMCIINDQCRVGVVILLPSAGAPAVCFTVWYIMYTQRAVHMNCQSC